MDQSCSSFRKGTGQPSPLPKWLFVGVLLVLLYGAQTTARAGDLQFTTESSQGLRLVAAHVPTLNDGESPGLWSLLRLHFDREGSAAGIHVTITKDGTGSWGAASAPGLNPNDVDIAVPNDIFSNDWRYTSTDRSDSPKGLITHLHFSAEGADQSTSGALVHSSWDPSNRSAYGNTPLYVSVGAERPAAWPFRKIDTDDLPLLADHEECLSRIRGIYVPQDLQAGSWLKAPGTGAWVRSGGILILQQPGKDVWTPQGVGMVVHSPGCPDQAALNRMTLITTKTLVRWNSLTAPLQGTWPGFDAPVAWVFTTLGLYVLLVLPVNYFLLRRISRREGAWVTIPLLSASFGLLLGIICYASKGITPQVARVALVEQIAPGIYSAMGHVSIFSPRAAHYHVRLPTGALANWQVAPNPLDPSSYGLNGRANRVSTEEGAEPGVTGLPVSPWCSSDVSYHFSPAIAGLIRGGASYTLRGGWKASVQNHSSLDLEDCRVWASGRYLSLPDLPAGQSAVTKKTTAASEPAKANHAGVYYGYQQGYSDGRYTGGYPSGAGGYSATDDDNNDEYNDPVAHPSDADSGRSSSFRARIRHQEWKWLGEYLGQTMHRNGAYLLGWSSRPLQSATVDGLGQYEDETLVITPLEIVPGDGGLVAPAGSMPITAMSGPPTTGTTPSGHTDNSAYAVVSLPAAALSHPEAALRLTIALNEQNGGSTTGSTGAMSDPDTNTRQAAKLLPRVWNNQEKQWVPLFRLKDGQVKSLTLRPIGTYAAPLAPPGSGPWTPLIYLKCDNSGNLVSFTSITASLNDPTPIANADGAMLRRTEK